MSLEECLDCGRTDGGCDRVVADSKRTELIERVRGLIAEVTIVPASIARSAEMEVLVYDGLAESIVAVFERAHTPCEAVSDDERGYDSDMAVMLSQLVEDEPMWSCVVIAKKLRAAGFRRPVQGEPTDAIRALNDLTVAAHGVNSKADDAEFLRGHIHQAVPVIRAALHRHGAKSDTQGEPSDAIVLSALNAHYRTRAVQSGFDEPEDAPSLDLYSSHSINRMRAALRAAFSVQGGNSR